MLNRYMNRKSEAAEDESILLSCSVSHFPFISSPTAKLRMTLTLYTV